ncbi:MAG: FAD-dependent oxidoreductase [Planctomycetota bacterium]|nr:MAG: FAD-dependent oxidoreductase [Planctomycetota bacterium]
MEIRLHGRGGQGGVTCAKILAAIYAREGKSVQTFGDYAGERSGAPVRAYTRVEDGRITNRNKVYRPDHLLVLDPTLLGDEVVTGLKPGGTLLINSPEPLETHRARFGAFRVAVVDATSIARAHGIGTRSVVIVNTTIAGAWAKVMNVPLDRVEEVYRDLGLLSNFPAARDAYESVRFDGAPRAADATAADAAAPPAELPKVEPLVEHRSSPPTPLKTGSWRTQTPVYTEHLAPCSAWCPAGNDAIGFVQALAREGEEQAAAVLGGTTPLAAVCGRVCPAPCMEGCNRAELDGAVNIRGIERWIADHVPVARRRPAACADSKRIAIVGSGPAGLSAAYQLALLGHAVTIFEGEDQLGGVLRTGIPTYRLPREVLDREIDAILALGVEARCGEFLSRERLAALAEEYDGLILATGLQKLRTLAVPGADLVGIEQGIRYLHRVNLEGGAPLSGEVFVLGGGNTAMDCARSALRSGADRVVVAYRRTRKEMPAIREEIEEAELEGIEIEELVAPVAFHGDGRVAEIEFAEVDLGEPDESGRRRPLISERTFRVPCDHVLLALGQSGDLSLLPEGWELAEDGRLVAPDRAPVAYAAGDLATGDGTVTHAIGSGRRAAGLLLRALGFEAEVFERPDRSKAVPVTDIRLDHFGRAAAAADRHLPVPERLNGFAEVNRGLADGLEAHRCFSCGHCTECDTCLVYCPEGIIRRRTERGYEVDYSYCKGCGICVTECPRSAMEMQSS